MITVDKVKPAQDPKTGRFVSENSGGPGRPKGSRNKLGEAFLKDMQQAWEERGPEVIQEVMNEKPDQFLKVVASILPKELNLNVNDVDSLEHDELIERIRNLDAHIRPFLSNEGVPGADGGTETQRTH